MEVAYITVMVTLRVPLDGTNAEIEAARMLNEGDLPNAFQVVGDIHVQEFEVEANEEMLVSDMREDMPFFEKRNSTYIRKGD
jgi:hypothetical protein